MNDSDDNRAIIFDSYRPKLLGLVYRITGSAVEAEDIVQETFLKWTVADQHKVKSQYAWLMTVATRISLDHLKSARVKRESYIGPWLPEPYLVDHKTPDKDIELDESITMALLVLLEQLSPSERATFILHDVFDFNFNEIGGMLEKKGSTCRQLASRARSKISRDTKQNSINKDEHTKIVSAFFNAVKGGKMENLLSLLKENIIFHSDGGGKASAALKLLEGRNKVATFILNVVTPNVSDSESQKAITSPLWFNGSPGIVVWVGSTPVSAFNFEIDNGLIGKIHVLRNPDKLELFKRVPREKL